MDGLSQMEERITGETSFEKREIMTEELRVQNAQFSEEKGFILRYTEKEV